MNKTMCDGYGRFAFRRVMVAVLAAAALSACAERAYLADAGWRQDMPGLAADQAQADSMIPIAADTALAVDPTLASANGAGQCKIHRLAAGPDDPTDAELQAAYACTSASVAQAYAGSAHVLVRDMLGWRRITATPFFSDALGDRYGIVYANDRVLGLESSDEHFDRGFPVGATLAVSTFTVTDGGLAEPGPLVLVEKMEPGFFALQGNWRYTIVDVSGQVMAVTRGLNAADVSVCSACTHSQADLLYASLLNNGIIPYAEGDGPAFPSVDTYGTSGGLVPPTQQQKGDGSGGLTGGAVLDPNAPILDPNAPVTDG